jgi:acetyltransferase-like isoleucine patch superfamily enzyme
MMIYKKIALLLTALIGFTFAIIFPYSLSLLIKRTKRRVYSYWLQREFKSFGKQSIIGEDLYLIGGKYIEIGTVCRVGRRGVITAWDKYEGYDFSPQIKIGNNSCIGEFCHITAINKIIIGRNVLTGRRLTITDNSHGNYSEGIIDIDIAPIKRPLFSKGPVIIEDNVWIGDKVSILPDVRIGCGSIIGANSVVTKDVPANCIAGGNPARVIKFLYIK